MPPSSDPIVKHENKAQLSIDINVRTSVSSFCYSIERHTHFHMIVSKVQPPLSGPWDALMHDMYLLTLWFVVMLCHNFDCCGVCVGGGDILVII